MDVVQVAGSLELGSAELAERFVGAPMAVAGHVPTGGLGAEVDLDADEERADW